MVVYFEGTTLHGIRVGDPLTIELMGFDVPLHGHVQRMARGINFPNHTPAVLGLASVNPVFTRVRLAQHILVHIQMDSVPEGLLLVAGETATVGPLATGMASGAHGLLARLFSP